MPPGWGPQQGTVASSQTAVVHTPLVILTRSHTQEMGFDTACPFGSCALPGERVGVWGETGGFSRRETRKLGDGLGRGRIRALGTSPWQGTTPRCPGCLSLLPARVYTQVRHSGSRQGLWLRFSEPVGAPSQVSGVGICCIPKLLPSYSPPKHTAPRGARTHPRALKDASRRDALKQAVPGPPAWGAWLLAGWSHPRGVSASGAGGSGAVTVAVSASRVSHPRVCLAGLLGMDLGHEDKIWGHLGVW